MREASSKLHWRESKMRCVDDVKVAAVQISSETNEADGNLRKIKKKITEAAENGAELIVFPECSNSWYVFKDPDHARRCATTIPGPLTDGISQSASEYKVYVAMGLSEWEDYKSLFNTSLLFGPDGSILGKYRKLLLRATDQAWFQEGDLGHPVFDTKVGRIGLFICADARIPEIARNEALMGAEVLLNSSCWGGREQYLIHVPTRAVENRVWIVSADKVGPEPPFNYPGHSFVISPSGEVVAEAGEEEEIIYATIDLKLARNKKLNLHNDIFKDRRPNTYEALGRPIEETPLYNILRMPVIPEKMCIQGGVLQLELGAHLEAVLSGIRTAAMHGSRLMVLPEMSLAEGPVKSRREAIEASIDVPGPLTKEVEEVAEKCSCFVVAGLIEREDDRLYNTAVLIGPKGIIGKYRKMHLWRREKEWFIQGNLGYPIFETPFGNIGIMIGYDGFFPEVPGVLTLMGADLIAWPCDWTSLLYPRYIAPARALENRVFVMAANWVGTAGGETLIGQSRIVDPLGRVLAQAVGDGEQYSHSRCMDLAMARCKRIDPRTDICVCRTRLFHTKEENRRGI